MTQETLNQSNESLKPKKKGKVKKIILRSLLAALIAGGIVGGTAAVDIHNAKKRKQTDKELYGEIKVKPEKTVDIVRPDMEGGPDTLHVALDTILSHNDDIISIDATKLESIMLGEESLKTTDDGLFYKLDKDREKWGIDRNPHSKSIIGRFIGKFKEGSYGPYQVQAEAIDKYKNNPELYNDLCKRIADFRFPDANGEYVPLHEIIGLTEDEMIKQIQNHEIYTFIGGERFLAACGIVLIDEIARETSSMIDSYDGSNGYNKWTENTKNTEKNHPELRKSDNNIMSPYILLNTGNVTYNGIGDLFNDDAFTNGMISAYWCMDYINNVKNSDYLFILSLLELNERFNNPTGELNIYTPTGNFGPTTLKLVNKHFHQDFKDEAAAKKYMNELPAEELQKIKDEALNSFEQNMRLLYTLNSGDTHGINQEQAKYLSECLDITFNHMYAGVTIFSNFVQQNCGDKSDSLSTLRNNYVKGQDKNSLEEIKKIMTDEGTFTSFTGLNKASYLKWIKYYLGPTLIGATDWVYQTGGIVPVIQDNPGGTKMSNEQNSIARFSIGVILEHVAQAERVRGVKYVLEPSDTDIDSLKHIMRSKKAVKKYLQTCKTINGDSITSYQDIPDELVSEMLRGSDGYYPLFENGEWSYEGDTIYIKYIGLDKTYHIITVNKPATKTIQEKVVKKQGKGKKARNKTIIQNKTVKLCTVNNNGSLTMQKGGSFQEILFIYSQNNSQIKKVLESIAGKPIVQKSDIDPNLIKQVIRHPDGSVRANVNLVNAGDEFIIAIPLN